VAATTLIVIGLRESKRIESERCRAARVASELSLKVLHLDLDPAKPIPPNKKSLP